MGMRRRFDTSRRNHATRKAKSVILIATEGNNKTETNYFRSLSRNSCKYVVQFAHGNETDPIKLLGHLKDDFLKNQLDADEGDCAFVVLDLDCDEARANTIRNLVKEAVPFQFIVSNPCFEVWFLDHFRFSTGEFRDSKAVVAELKREVPDYEKNMDLTDLLLSSTDKALKNEEKVVDAQEQCGKHWISADCNPRTDVPVIVKMLSE
jgi:hypothetical protein